MSNRTILALLDRARVLLTATGSGELSLLLPSLGFDTDELAHGRELYETCDHVRVAANNAYGAKEGCTSAVVEQTQKVRSQYSRLHRMARGIFANEHEASKTLGLVIRRPARPQVQLGAENTDAQQPAPKRSTTGARSQAVFLGNARQLYEGALDYPQILAALSKYGYTEARLRAERLDLATLEAFDVELERLKGNAKQRTAEQKAAAAALQKWMKRFASIIVPALMDRPELLESMGLKPRGRRAQA